MARERAKREEAVKMVALGVRINGFGVYFDGAFLRIGTGVGIKPEEMMEDKRYTDTQVVAVRGGLTKQGFKDAAAALAGRRTP